MSFGHLIVILLIILVLFGAGKLPQVMADLAKGLRAFKDNLGDDRKQLSDKTDDDHKKKDS